MNNLNTGKLLLMAINASVEAGKAILKHYDSSYTIEYKTDNSPLTSADKEAHSCIVRDLNQSKLPIHSEEGKDIGYELRKSWKLYWLVDPLDGTKEFINGNGEFTVNIALIEDGKPIMGIIYVPVWGLLYFGAKEYGSYMINILKNDIGKVSTSQEIIKKADKLPIAYDRKVTIMGSRSHQTEENNRIINSFADHFDDVLIVNAGSSLKFCRMAEGAADFYPRLGPTMEWDTAAGHAICKFAGVDVLVYQSDKELVYNKVNLLNPSFLAIQNKYRQLILQGTSDTK